VVLRFAPVSYLTTHAEQKKNIQEGKSDGFLSYKFNSPSDTK
jgi:hypothetical protein